MQYRHKACVRQEFCRKCMSGPSYPLASCTPASAPFQSSNYKTFRSDSSSKTVLPFIFRPFPKTSTISNLIGCALDGYRSLSTSTLIARRFTLWDSFCSEFQFQLCPFTRTSLLSTFGSNIPLTCCHKNECIGFHLCTFLGCQKLSVYWSKIIHDSTCSRSLCAVLLYLAGFKLRMTVMYVRSIPVTVKLSVPDLYIKTFYN
jgi:hypothetical protein